MKKARQVQIRRATVDDASAVASVLRQAFAEYEPLYTRQGYVATTPEKAAILLRMQEGPLWVALHEKRIVGTASAVHKHTGLYVRGMAVVPAARGLGVGLRLLDQIEAFAVQGRCSRLFLSTTPFLNRAIRLYEGFGFRVTDEGPNDLFGTPLVSMEKSLAGGTLSRRCKTTPPQPPLP
jgi:ribosomal protein S18 acetylase RimI-like enzyme